MLLNSPTVLRALRLLSSKISIGFAVLVLTGAGFASAQAQSLTQTTTKPVPDRLVNPINENARLTLPNTVHPLANRANDRGAVGDGLKLDRMQIVLKRSDAQEADLKQTISDMHTPGSASYHKWLTPDEFGKRFGPSDADVAKLTSWLQSHGFNVTKLNPGRGTLEFAGSAGQFRDTFKSQIHTYQVKSFGGVDGKTPQVEMHYGNAADPQIPAALAPIFGGFTSLNNFRVKNFSKKLGTASFNPVTHESKPNWTVGTASSYNLLLAPGDFDVQYSLPSHATAGTNDGTGQSIAIINDSNINISLVNRFRTLFSLPTNNPPQVIIDGNDPGVDGINNPDGPNYDSIESYLDVEWAGAVAPAATVNLVVAADTALGYGLIFAAERAVYSNVSPVISLSFGNCEAALGSTNLFWNGLWEEAAAQGITAMVSSGDSGSAGCDGSGQAFAVYGQAVNGLGSTPYNVSVGGTDFYYSGGSTEFSTYWNTTPSDAAPTVSLLKPVPEQPWNSSQFGLNIYDYFSEYGNTTIAGGSGGASTAGYPTTVGSTTTYGPYPKPSWQKGTGVPADSARDLPDVSLFAAFLGNGSSYSLCASDGDCEPAANGVVQISEVGGTSASSPSFAGVMALVNQQYGRQGQANFVLYPLATQYPAAFNDVTVGTNTVPCNLDEVTDGTYDYFPVNCQTVANELTGDDSTYGSSLEGEIGLAAGVAAYSAGTGYDLASGLGSVNVSTLLADWNKVTFAATTTTLTPSVTSFAHGTPITVSGTVTGTAPTGDVALVTDSTEQSQQGKTYFTLGSDGTYTGIVNYLPGGTYNIWGNYGGDNANATSSSLANKVQITVTPEASTTALSVYTVNQSTGSYQSAPASLSYGQQVILSAQTAPTAATSVYGIPTGSVVFSNGSATLNTAVVNTSGEASYFGTYPVSATAYSIKAAYSGDGSYSASASSTASFTVAKNTPTFNLNISNSDSQNNTYGPQQTFLTISFENSNGFSQNALPPTGTVTVTGGPSGTLTGTLSGGVDPFTGGALGVVTLALPAGITSGTLGLTFAYAGDANYNAVTTPKYGFPFLSAGTGLTSTTTVAATPTTAGPASQVQLTTTVTGQAGKAAPTGTITVFGPGVEFGQFTLPVGTSDSTTETLTFTSEGLLQGSNQFTVQYSGDTNYLPSSGIVTVSNPLSDFQLVPLTTILSVATSGTAIGTATDTINLVSTTTFAGTVGFTCSGAGGVTCSVTPSPATLTAGGQASVTLSVNSAAVTKAGTYNVVVTGSDTTGNFVHTLGFQVVVPQVSTTPSYALTGTALAATTVGSSATSTITTTPTNSFAGTVALTCAVTAPTGAVSVPTCALSPTSVAITTATAVTSALTVTTTATTTAGSYSVVVTGTSGTTTETVTLPLVVNSTTTTPTFTLTGLMNEGATAGAAPTSTVTVTPSGGFTGSVALTCAVTGPTGATIIPTCALVPTSVSLSTAAVASTLTVTTATGTIAGDYTVTVTGTSGTTVETESFTLTVSAATTTGSIMVSATTPVTIATQGATGTSTVTVTPSGGFTGSVAVTCDITASPTGATDLPACSLSPTSVSVTTAAAVTSTLTISTTAQTTSQLRTPGKTLFTIGGGVTMAALFFLGGPIGRRRRMTLKAMRTMRILSVAALFALIAGAAMGCGGGSTPPPTMTGGTTTGAYTVTLTATPATGTAVTTTVAVTVN